MNRQDFSYSLPKGLIAQYPAAERTASRLLALDKASNEVVHTHFTDIVELLNANDLLVFNDTRVIPARLFGEKETGGKVEVLLERITGGTRGVAQIKASKPPKPDSKILLPNDLALKVIDRIDDMYLVEGIGDFSLAMILQAVGHTPLPPYIEREDEAQDRDRYQTVYARREGAVAAPTAGLHFDQQLLSHIVAKGVSSTYVTLHVGAGTFQPVRTENIEDHRIHAEYIEVSAETCNLVRETRSRGGRVIAVGTTAVRCLETASPTTAWIEPYYGDTEIFIYPGYEFKIVDAMITNFHLPESTLLMLVSAFAGLEQTKNAYQQAIENEYRFYSYGDAMFIR